MHLLHGRAPISRPAYWQKVLDDMYVLYLISFDLIGFTNKCLAVIERYYLDLQFQITQRFTDFQLIPIISFVYALSLHMLSAHPRKLLISCTCMVNLRHKAELPRLLPDPNADQKWYQNQSLREYLLQVTVILIQ